MGITTDHRYRSDEAPKSEFEARLEYLSNGIDQASHALVELSSGGRHTYEEREAS